MVRRFDPEPARVVEQADVGETLPQAVLQCSAPFPAVGRGDHDADAEHACHFGADLIEVRAIEDQPGEAGVQGVGAGECVGLALAELGEGLFDEIVEGQVQRETQHGEVEFVGQGQRPFGNGVEVAAQFDADSGELTVVELGYQLGEHFGRILVSRGEWVSGGHQKFLRFDPVQDVGDFHHVDRGNSTVETAFAGEDRGSFEAAEVE